MNIRLWFDFGRTEDHYVPACYSEADIQQVCGVYGAHAYTLHPEPSDG